jgi:molybdopterin/thiamine biosynthesis adenylyltransferase
VRCSAMGVFAPLVGIIGATQANEALKVLLQNMPSSTGKLLLLDALTMRWREIKLTKDQNCTVCGLQNT